MLGENSAVTEEDSMKGIDVSSNQHPANRPIDWEAVAEAGYSFAVVKASQGTAYVNPWCTRDLEDARAAGLFVGAYHYYEPGQDAAVQAKTFVAAVTLQLLDIGPWLDWEPPAMGPYQAKQYIDAFFEEARSARPGIGLYCDMSWHDQLREEAALPARLWLAKLDEGAPTDAIIWQDAWAVDVPGVPAPVDTDVLLRTRSVNLASSPPARPSAAMAKPVRLPAEPGPDRSGETDDGHQDDDLNQHD